MVNVQQNDSKYRLFKKFFSFGPDCYVMLSFCYLNYNIMDKKSYFEFKNYKLEIFHLILSCIKHYNCK